MKRHSQNTRGTVGEPSEQAISCATAEVTGKCAPLFALWLCALVVFLTGCCVTAGTDGNIKVISCRFLWKSEDVSFSVRSTNINARLTLGKSNTDADAVGAVTEGAVKALTRP